MALTMFEKIWNSHVVYQEKGKPNLIYIDLHLVHEVTSPQAFEGLRLKERTVRRPNLTFATMDHNVPTTDRSKPIDDPISKKQMETLATNCAEFDICLLDLHNPNNGIVHIIGPELGLTQPGKTIVCGDSHTSTHGAFGALAFGIGTSEVEHVLATQCLYQNKPKTLAINCKGKIDDMVSAKDVILAIIGRLGTAGATGHVIEYRGDMIRNFDMAGRMTICNMSIEAGARAGMIAPDEVTFNFLKGRQYAPEGTAFKSAVNDWQNLPTDEGAQFDREINLNLDGLPPQVTWGTNPGMVTDVTGHIPNPDNFDNIVDKKAAESALQYMGLKPATAIKDICLDRVFIGSCTNGTLEDMRAAASMVKGRKVSPKVKAMVVPGSQQIKKQAEEEGLHEIFLQAGFEWRESGCSMCLAMNPDVLSPGERCASTSNRNFEGRQGRGSRTHLVSPKMAAAAAIAGHFVDIREW